MQSCLLHLQTTIDKCLSTEFLNSGGTGQFTSLALSESFVRVFAAVKRAASEACLGDDFQKVLDAIVTAWTSFKDKLNFDSLLFSNLLDILEGSIVVILDLLQILVTVTAQIAAEAIKTWQAFLSLPLDMPILTPIFKHVTNQDLQ